MTKLNIPYTVIRDAVKTALFEDLAGQRDITSLLIPESTPANTHIFTRENMILCGQAWVNEVFQQIDATIRIDWKFNDGDSVSTNQTICKLQGPARCLLTGERTALNFLQTLSGTATITHKFVELLKDSKTKLLDTRKTIPGLRLAQKYAVRCGGGHNHRMGLYDAFLIKKNHIRAFGSITKVISIAKKSAPGKKVEIEVENLEQLQEAINAKADTIMLDNFTFEQMQKAVTINKNQVKLEISGNINLENIKDIANTGVDYVSIGALTKNITAIDLSMQLE
ncbi:MAG: nicotinate-nucleotide pyrophosphorylase [Coxiella sp. DG_40]|nr:MAG: nicotinate-nucleotide pyrophosphorylase [Coxiella sp. DG_40]